MAITTSQCTGRVVESLHAALTALLAAGDPSTWPGFTTVKKSLVRTILAGEIAGPQARPVHVKLFRAVRLSDRARDALLGSRGEKEMANLLAAAERGIAVVSALAAGRVRGTLGARSFLVTATAPGTALPRGPLSSEIATRVGAFLRAAHDRGLRARDLHPGNLLLLSDGEVVLLDLTSAALGTPLEAEERAHALAFFCQDLDAGVANPAAAPLIAAYGLSPAMFRLAVQIGQRLRRRGLLSFGKRALRACRQTVLARGPGGAREFHHAPTQDLLPAAQELLARIDTVEPLRRGRRGAVWLDQDLVVKQRTRAAARRLFSAAYLLHFAGVQSPEPVLLRIEQDRGLVVTKRIRRPSLAIEVTQGTVDLEDAAKSLGDGFGRLHAHGLRNRDAKLENLVRDPETRSVCFVDLDGIRVRGCADTRGQAADLGRLLAAFRAAAAGLETQRVLRVLAAFRRSYTAARKCLSSPNPSSHLWNLAARRADAWRTAHASR